MTSTQNVTYDTRLLGGKDRQGDCVLDIRRTPWKMAVWDRLRQVEADVAQAISALGWKMDMADLRLQITGPADPSSARQMAAAGALVREIYELIEAARRCLDPAGTGRRLWDFLTGRLLMSAYANLHMAERQRVLLFSADQLRAALPSIRQRVIAYLPADEPRRIALDGVPDMTVPAHQALAHLQRQIAGKLDAATCRHPDDVPTATSAPPAAPAHACDIIDLTPMLGKDQRIAAEALGAAFTSEDLQQSQVRQFRSVLFGTFIGLIIVVGILWVIGFSNPKLIPLCFPMQGGTAGEMICPSGGHAPGTADLPLVLGLGAVGATLAVARNLAGLNPAGVRYSLSVAQGMLKIAFGAITAVLGILILQTQTNLPGILGTQAALLTSAVVFGYGQQLFTGLLDRRAASLTSAASPMTPSPASNTASAEARTQ